jgi:hypothetical protein
VQPAATWPRARVIVTRSAPSDCRSEANSRTTRGSLADTVPVAGDAEPGEWVSAYCAVRPTSQHRRS